MRALFRRAVRLVAPSSTYWLFVSILTFILAEIVASIAFGGAPVNVAHAQSVFAIDGPTTVSHDENDTANVATYTVTGGQPNTAVTWGIDGTDARRFSVNASGELSFTAARNFERPNDGNRDNIYEIQLSATAGPDYESVDISVTIQDVNEPPQFDVVSDSLTIVENAPANRNVGGALAATDEDDGDDWTFSLSGDDAASFLIEEASGQIRVRSGTLLDYETNAEYMFTATVTDLGGLSDSMPISITVLNEDDPGVVTFDKTQPTVGAQISATLSDDDGVVGTVRWRWRRAQSVDDSYALIQGAESATYTPAGPDAGYVLKATARYTDSFDSNKTVEATTNVVLINGPPAFDEGPTATREIGDGSVGGTEVGMPVSASDLQNDDLSYSISGPDADDFAINEDSGQISVATGKTLSLAEKASHTVTVSVSDGKDESGQSDTAVDDTIAVTISVVKVNHAPAFATETLQRIVLEESTSGTNVGEPITAMDSDDDVLTYALSGDDAGKFTIDTTAGQISVGDEALPLAATEAEYTLTVTATDPGDLSDTVAVTITVTTPNEPATITGPSAVNYAENATATVATYVATDPDDDDASITLTLGGTDALLFELSDTGALSFKASPDFETPGDANDDNIYEITLTASDGSLSDSVDTEVTVTNVNEPPSLTGLTDASYAENGTTSVATYTASDVDSNTSITLTLGGTDALRFEIAETGVLSFKVSPDYETPGDANGDNVFEITVTASDGTLSDSVDIEVTVTNVNESPSLTGPTDASYAENGTTSVATYTASDVDSNTSITLTLGGPDAVRFEISETGVLSFKVSPDFETPGDANEDNVYEITVTASDGTLSDAVDIDVTVTNVNEPLAIDGSVSVSYAENGTDAVGTFTADDPEVDDPVTWSLDGTDAASFAISLAGGLSFNVSPNFEAPHDANQNNVYEITVGATDGNSDASLDIEVTVTNVGESTTITGPATVNYAENDTATVATYIAIDPEMAGPVTWTVGGTDAVRFSIASAGTLSFTTAPNFERARDANQDNTYEVTITAGDGDLSASVEVTVTVQDVNEAPQFEVEAASLSIAENAPGGRSVGVALTASDEDDGDDWTFSISGSDAGPFLIEASSGQIRVGTDALLDYETDAEYVFTATATDLSGLSDSILITVSILDADDPGVVRFNTSEPHVGAPITVGLADDDGVVGNVGWQWSRAPIADDPFEQIEGVQGATYTPTQLDLDYVLKAIVTYTDSYGSNKTAEATSSAIRLNDPPQFDEGTAATREIADGSTGKEEVGAPVSATDPEGDDLSYSLSGTDASNFEIDGDTGQISVATDKTLSNAGQAVHTLTVSVNDGKNESGQSDTTADDSIGVTINVVKANQPPTFPAETAQRTVQEEAASGTNVGNPVTATDPDDDGLTYALSGDDAGKYTIDAATGQISVGDEALPLAAIEAEYTVIVTATDPGNLHDTVAVTITATTPGELQTIMGPATVNFVENGTAAVATYSVTDPDNTTITWSIDGTDAARFAIGTTGVLSFLTAPDFERALDANQDDTYEITINVSGDLSASVDVSVTVTNINEMPTLTGPSVINYAEKDETAVAIYAAVDPDGDTTFTWSVGGTDALRFEITEEGSLSFRAPPDFESPGDSNEDNIYELTITASDGDLSASIDVMATVTNVNEIPTLTGPSAIDYVENSETAVATYSVTDPDGDATIAWSVDGTDAVRFTIGVTGVLSFTRAPDFERARDANQDNVYEIVITASDGDLSASVDVTVTVTNVNEIPTLNGRSTIDYEENREVAVATYTAMDPDSNTTITWMVSGADALLFEITREGSLSFRAPPDFGSPRDSNEDNVYEIIITASDGDLSDSINVKVTVTHVNEIPSLTGPSGINYAEKGEAAVAIYAATDPDSDTAITWTVSGVDGLLFEITGEGSLSFKAPPNFGSPSDSNKDNIYEIIIIASDGDLSVSLEVLVTVTNVNQAPTITGPTSFNYAENGAEDTATYAATDPDNDASIVWNLQGADASSFEITEEGVLSFETSPDFEDPGDANQDNTYEVEVIASDGNLSESLHVAVSVTNLNEVPSVIGPIAVSYAENGTASVATYNATDPDSDAAFITWAVDEADSPSFEITGDGALSFMMPPDFESPSDANEDNVYEITITASDGDLSASLNVFVTVTDVNDAATISGPANVYYAENDTSNVTTYTATYPEGDAASVIWSVDGADASGFEITEDGVLSFETPPDFEQPNDTNLDNVYEITIAATHGRLSALVDVTVTVANANDAPSFPVERLVAGIPENSCPGAYTILRGIPGSEGLRVDEDGDPLTFALSGPDAASFVIHTPTGYVTLGPGTALDHEAVKNSYVLRVSVADGRNAAGDAELTPVADDVLGLVAMVTDVDEPSVFVEATLQRDSCGRPDGYVPVQLEREVTKRSPRFSPAGEPIAAIDPELDAISYSITTADAPPPFVIDPASGQIKLSGTFDLSSLRRLYTVRITASDGAQETAIEARIRIVSAPAPPKPKPTPEASNTERDSREEVPSSPPKPAPTPKASNTERDSGEEAPLSPPKSGDSLAETDARDSDVFPSSLTVPPPPIVPQRFVQVEGAMPVQALAGVAMESDVGNVSLSASPGALSTPYQVRLSEDWNHCADTGYPTSVTPLICVAVELFDALGHKLPPIRFSRPVSLQFMVQPTLISGHGVSQAIEQERSKGSLGIMSLSDHMENWQDAESATHSMDNGARVVATSILEPGKFMVVSQPRRSPNPGIASGFPKAVSALWLASGDTSRTPQDLGQGRAGPTLEMPASVRPYANMMSISSIQRGSARAIPGLLVAFFLDVTFVLMTASVIYRIARPRS